MTLRKQVKGEVIPPPMTAKKRVIKAKKTTRKAHRHFKTCFADCMNLQQIERAILRVVEYHHPTELDSNQLMLATHTFPGFENAAFSGGYFNQALQALCDDEVLDIVDEAADVYTYRQSGVYGIRFRAATA